jgi:hypothetical protein
LSEMPQPVTPPATAPTAASIDLLPEAPVEALPKAATIAKPIGGPRRLAPAAPLPAAPAARPRVVGPTAVASGHVPDPGEVPTAAPTPSTGSPDSERHEDPPIAVPSVPPAIDSLVKAVRDDIEEDEARHK